MKIVSSVPRIVRNIILIFFGTGIYAFGVYAFTAPNDIAPGGVTGLVTVINAFTSLPIGATVTVINIPLLLLGFKILGKEFFWYTLLSTIFFQVQMDYIFPFLPVYQGNMLLAGIFGGLFIGVGLAIVFMSGGSTGGTDIINRIVQYKMPHIKIGTLTFLSDFVVIAIAAVAYRSIEAALYAIIAMFVSSKAIDGLMYGLNLRKLVFIVSKRADEIARVIAHDLDRGCTLMNARGAYTGSRKDVILCACKNNEFYRLKHLVKRIDPESFMIVTDSGEVLGEGFKPLKGKNS